MILILRIDDRLLHGQVAYSWKSALHYDAIVIASDVAANDELRKTTIKLCCPDGVKLATRTIQDAAVLLQHKTLATMRVFVICPDPKSAYELLTQLEEKPCVNLGGMQMEDGKRLFSKAVYVNDADVNYLDKLHELGYTIQIQEVPSTAIHDYQTIRSKFTNK